MLNNSNPSNPHSISVMINCPLKLILARICQASKPASQQRKVLLLSIWIWVELRRDTTTQPGLLSVVQWDCWHSSIPVSIVSQLHIIYYQIQSSPVPSVASQELFHSHCLIDLTVYERWFIVYVHWLWPAGLQQPAIHSRLAQLQFGIITNMKSLMLFELNNKWMRGKVCPGFTSGFSVIIYHYV